MKSYGFVATLVGTGLLAVAACAVDAPAFCSEPSR